MSNFLYAHRQFIGYQSFCSFRPRGVYKFQEYLKTYQFNSKDGIWSLGASSVKLRISTLNVL